MSKFPNPYIIKLFQKLGKIPSKIFSLKIDRYIYMAIYDYFPNIYLKFPITQLWLKIFPKYKNNFLKIACFKSFRTVPLNFLRISKHMPISSEVWNI